MNGYLLEFSLNSIAFVLKQFLLSRLLFRVSIASSSVVGFIFRFVLFFVFNLMACLVCVDPFSLHHLRGEMTAAELPQHKHIQLQAKVHDVQGVAREIERKQQEKQYQHRAPRTKLTSQFAMLLAYFYIPKYFPSLVAFRMPLLLLFSMTANNFSSIPAINCVSTHTHSTCAWCALWHIPVYHHHTSILHALTHTFAISHKQ